jgi:hypothetical protein
MANVLMVTDYAGRLHIMPLGNKPFFQSRNKTVKSKQYVFREMEEKAAYEFNEKNKGVDPDFITAKKAVNVIQDKDAEIERLKAQLAALQAKPAEKAGDTAVEVIARIKAATTVEELSALIVPGETRKTVLDELAKKSAELATVTN